MANKKKKAGQAITPKKEVVQKKADAKLYITLAVAVLALAIITVGIVLIIKATSSAKAQTQPTAAEPSQTVEEAAAYYADISIRDYGTVTLELYPETAPITVDNFVTLARSGFYDGLTFHRIMNGFMMQGGDPDGNGTGGSGTTIKGEFSANGVDNPISHVRGTVSMARNSRSMDSASSQFFIVQSDSTFLDGQYAAFGSVTSGMDIVDKICADARPTDDNGTIPAEEQPVIESITIREE